MNDLVTGAVLHESSARRAAPLPPYVETETTDIPSTLDVSESTGACRLDLLVDDPIVVPELLAYPPGPQRDRFTLTALRIGVLALKQAQGRLDADAIRGEGERLLSTLEERLGQHQRSVHDHVATTLREYFDPQNGRFNERVEALVKSGGELERLMRAQIGASDSELAKTLAAHVGDQSALMKILRPSESEGILGALSDAMQRALLAQREAILSEFSLDNGAGALSRLVKEMNRENDEFRTHVRESLAALQARRGEAQRSTRHGLEFEQALVEFVIAHGQAAGDVVEHTAGSTGLIRNCKIGDIVVTLGPEHAAAGARIVLEAKQHAGYRLPDALTEIEQARKNRQACAGLFVFSRRTCGEHMAPLARYGADVVAVWDSEDAATDVILTAGLSLVRALCARTGADERQVDVDIERMTRAMLDVEKQVQGLDDIRKSAQSIRSCADKIEDRARLVSDNLLRATRALNEETETLRNANAE